MPLFEYKCEICNKVDEHIIDRANRHDTIKCSCGGSMQLCVSKANHKVNGYCYKNTYNPVKEQETPKAEPQKLLTRKPS